MFGLSKRKPEDGAVAFVRHTQNVWDYGDLEKRTLLLKRVIDAQDDRLFLAHVHATWTQIPYDTQMKLVLELMRREGNERTATRAGGIVADSFSEHYFNMIFGQKTSTGSWTVEDALGVWYSLGHFCLLMSIGTVAGLQEPDITTVIKLGEKALFNAWKMSPPTLKQYNQFNDTKLYSAFSIYTTITDPETLRRFFSLFVSEICGNNISFSPDEFAGGYLVQLLAGQMIEMDWVLQNKVSSVFAAVKRGVHETFSTFKF